MKTMIISIRYSLVLSRLMIRFGFLRSMGNKEMRTSADDQGRRRRTTHRMKALLMSTTFSVIQELNGTM